MKIQRGRYFTSFFSFLLRTCFYAVAAAQRRSASLLTLASSLLRSTKLARAEPVAKKEKE